MPGGNGQLNASLDPNQQDLLRAALSSNNPNTKSASNSGARSSTDLTNINQSFSFDNMDPAMFPSGAQANFGIGSFDSPLGAVDDSPYVDFLDANDPNFDFDYGDEDGQMIGDLPGADELHDKRKSPEDNNEDNDNGGKRREGDDKTAKKPGRKPLTSEPTSVSKSHNIPSKKTSTDTKQKRKAQNRAAQRAFRERKEKHLKDLETKVGELEKTSESANHENGLLRAQVERLQIELREYRKRLSLNSTSNLGRSPPTGNSLSFLSNSANGNNTNNFQFEFPRFGSVPSPIFPTGTTSSKPISPPATNGFNPSSIGSGPGVLSRDDSATRSISPRSQARMNSSISSTGGSPAVQSPATAANGTQSQSLTNDNMMNVFSSGFSGVTAAPAMDFNSFLPNTTAEPQSINGDSGSTSGQSRIFQFNSASVSSDSPGSSSSISQYGANSSCGTSPEPSHNSPSTGNKDATLDTINENGTVEGEGTFCDKLNMACGNYKNPIPRALSNGASGASMSMSNVATTSTAAPTLDSNSTDPLNDFGWLSNQNGGQFDPVLFGDYREPQNAIVGDGDFTGGFFNDALPTMDFGVGSPFNWADLTAPTGLTPSIQKSNPMEQADALQSGLEDVPEEVVPGEDPDKLLSCHKIW